MTPPRPGALLRRYVAGPGVDEYAGVVDGGQVRALLADERGSVVAQADASGAVVINGYGAWGEVGAGAVGRDGGRIRYTGQMYLPEAGIHHYKARAYSSRWGRFLQTDPVGDADDANLYAYVGNDPVNARDPDGTVAWAEALIGGGIELGSQLAFGDMWSTYRLAATQIATGRSCTACRAAGAGLAKVGISAAAGATGAGLLRYATVGLSTGQKVFVAANIGAKVGVVQQGFKGVVDQKLTARELAAAATVGAVAGPMSVYAPSAASTAAGRLGAPRGVANTFGSATDVTLGALGEAAQQGLSQPSGGLFSRPVPTGPLRSRGK